MQVGSSASPCQIFSCPGFESRYDLNFFSQTTVFCFFCMRSTHNSMGITLPLFSRSIRQQIVEIWWLEARKIAPKTLRAASAFFFLLPL